MPRLPDASALGPRSVARGSDMIVRDPTGEILADAGMRASDSVSRDLRSIQDHDDQFNYGRAKSALLSADIAVRKKFEDDPDFATQEKRYSETLGKAREDAAKMIRGNRSRIAFENDAKFDIERGAGAIRQQAKVKEGQWARSSLDETLQTSRTAALEARDPATREQLISSVRSSIDGALEGQYITPEQATELRQRWTASYGEGFVEVEPSDAQKLKLLRHPKGTPSDYIAPDKRQNMIEQLENKQRVLVDRREARAERAAAQIERQISSGIPATAQMWKEWNATIAGTSVAPQVKDMLAAEKDVQETLRKPIAEQVRLVQEKQASLKTNGGSVVDQANVQRLTNAVKQNVAQLQNDPLLFAESRLDAPAAPIDMSTLTDKAAVAQNAATFQERATQLRTISKRFGVQVPMKPFLPQEAAQFSLMLENASPKEAAELFAGLRDQTGSLDVFKGAMQQVAPDAPVKAMAGLLAAQQRELVTERNWFSADKSVTSKDVAATMLEGERLLNPSKGDKGEDGKPKTKQLLLPAQAQKGLQDTFARSVGTVFAGRPNAADMAYQAVQAYYVGAAAKSGMLAGDSQAVDTDLVRESVRATLGNVVDYNGNGSVLAPWGMAPDDFEDRVQTAFAAEAKRRGINGDISPDLSTFGLSNANADGLYTVTLGKEHNLLLDKQGNPVTLNLKPGDPRDAAGTIQR